MSYDWEASLQPHDPVRLCDDIIDLAPDRIGVRVR